MVRLTDRPDMTLDVYRGRKKATQYNNNNIISKKDDPEYWTQVALQTVLTRSDCW